MKNERSWLEVYIWFLSWCFFIIGHLVAFFGLAEMADHGSAVLFGIGLSAIFWPAVVLHWLKLTEQRQIKQPQAAEPVYTFVGKGIHN